VAPRRKYVENWPVWIAVNLVAIGLFAYKGLWLTVALYAIFVAMSVVGWRAWRPARGDRGSGGMSTGFVVALLGAESTGKTTLATRARRRAHRRRPAGCRRRRGAARVLRPRGPHPEARRTGGDRRRADAAHRTRPRPAPRSSSPTPLR
jgi:hypothetical protein